MKKFLLILGIILGICIALSGVWIPFYISSLLSPKNWYISFEIWWSFPMYMTLAVIGFAILGSGVAVVINYAIDLVES